MTLPWLLAVAAQPARPQQGCQLDVQTRATTNDGCGTTTYDLSASDGVDSFDAGYYTAYGQCLPAYYDCVCTYYPPGVEQGQMYFDYSGNASNGYTVWWNSIDYYPPDYMSCQGYGDCSDFGSMVYALAYQENYLGYDTLAGCG